MKKLNILKTYAFGLSALCLCINTAHSDEYEEQASCSFKTTSYEAKLIFGESPTCSGNSYNAKISWKNHRGNIATSFGALDEPAEYRPINPPNSKIQRLTGHHKYDKDEARLTYTISWQSDTTWNIHFVYSPKSGEERVYDKTASCLINYYTYSNAMASHDNDIPKMVEENGCTCAVS